MLIHASCAALAGEGVLLLGGPGSGKSDLLLRLLGRGWALVADDQVALLPEGGVTIAAPPPALAGLLELRGQGLVRDLDWQMAPLRLVAHLGPSAGRPRPPHERLPLPETWDGPTGPLPAIRLDGAAASAPDRLAMVLRVLRGGAAWAA